MIRDRDALILAAQLPRKQDLLSAHDAQAREAMSCLDRAERDAGFALSVLIALVAMGAFLTAASLLEGGSVGPAKAVIGLFVALAMAEALLPLRRGVADLGRMLAAAVHVVPQIAPEAPPMPKEVSGTGALLSLQRADLNVELHAGEAIALTGPSGSGKSTLLMQIAGLEDDTGIFLSGIRPGAWPEGALRNLITMLPQRSALIAGTVRDNLSLSGVLSDDMLWDALEMVDLAEDLAPRGGLDARLGEAGAGLSGGQARRLALARSCLKTPHILLLDEPTEGLDDRTAHRVLSNVRTALPEALIVAALHRGADHPIFDKSFHLTRNSVTMSPKNPGPDT